MHATWSVRIGRIYVRSTAMRPNNTCIYKSASCLSGKIAYFKQLPEAANTVYNNASLAVKLQMLMRTYPLCMTEVYSAHSHRLAGISCEPCELMNK